MTKKIFYICYYGGDNRSKSLAAEYKIRYICEALNENGVSVEIVSASGTLSDCWSPGKYEQLYSQTIIKRFSSWGAGNIFRRTLSRWWTLTMMFFYLLRRIKRGDNVIVYHSLGYMGMIQMLKLIRGFNLILEFEEVYGDVFDNMKVAKKEIKFAQLASSYLFPTEFLNDCINKNKKPHAIIYGSYNTPTISTPKFNDGRIHVLYSGSFDSRKGGVIMAIEMARFLPENYHVHISGFGSVDDTKKTQRCIDDISQECKCKITYEGCLSDIEYTSLLQRCHIGLNTFNPDAKFNETSFPSKLLAYLGYNLRVVSISISPITRSKIANLLNYYYEQTPEKIAEAVVNVDMVTPFNGQDELRYLASDFKHQISELLQ